MNELLNKVCLVAGASGTLGCAAARRLQADGARVVLACRSAKTKKPGELSSGPLPLPFYHFDVADWDQVRSAIEAIESDFGRIDVLVNCAGVLGPIGPFETSDVEDWVRTIGINLLGSMYLARAVIPAMRARGSGKIIFFSGGGAAYARPFFTAYSSSKAAVVRFAESLGQELKDANIQVNAVAPGPVKSRMWEEMRAAGASGGPMLLEELKRMDETGGTVPERAAGLVAFLASERSGKLTGRLLSAQWDDWENLETQMDRIASSDAGTLRRVPLN